MRISFFSAKLVYIVPFLFLCNTSIFAQDTTASYNGLALKPPMGWNTWNTFACNINEASIKSVADSIVSMGLKDVGYEYIVVDDCWQKSRGTDSVIVADITKFPSGIKALADYIHSKGLKFGIYSDAGTETCQGKPGSYGYEKIDAKTYASWGVDYVKFDWCSTDGENAPTQYTKMSKALLATGRPIVFSICEWGQSSPWLWAQKVGNLWRATSDIQPCWNCTQTWGGMGWTLIVDKVAGLSRYSGPGHWNDPDMLEVGNTGLTTTESQAHFSMWCMLAAPLIAGNDIRSMSADIKTILTNTEMIAIDQDSLGIQGVRIQNPGDGTEVWCKPLKDGTKAVALFNRTSDVVTMSFKLNQIGLLGGKATLRDLWQLKNHTMVDSFSTFVPSHGVVVYKVTGKIDNTVSLSLDQPTLTLLKGDTVILTPNIKPFYTEISGNTTNSKIVSISQSGINQYRIIAKDTGTCVVIISSVDGKLSDTCTVHVVTTLVNNTEVPLITNSIAVRVYPNPTNSNTISVQINNGTVGNTFEICIYTNEGKMIYSKTVTSFDNKIDLKINSVDFTNGLYHLIVKDSKKNTGEAKFAVIKNE